MRSFVITALMMTVCLGCETDRNQAFTAANLGIDDFDRSHSNVVDQFIVARLERLGIAPHHATEAELIRRMALDLTGSVPAAQDYATLHGQDAAAIADHYMATDGFIEMSQTLAADHLHFSNDNMFSTIEQLEALNEIVADHYRGVLSYERYVAAVLESKAFLSRFTSSADRCTATFIAFLGYEPVTEYDYQFGNIFNGYEMTNRRADPRDADYHNYEWTGTCDRRATSTEVETCEFAMWGYQGQSIEDAVRMLAAQPVFAEHAVDLVWERFIGAKIHTVAPELAVALADRFVEHRFDIRWLIKEVVTSVAYTQSHGYRPDDLVQD